MGIVFVILGIAMRLAFGISFEDPFAFIQLALPTDVSTMAEHFFENLIKLTSSMFWTVGAILAGLGFFR